MRIAKLLSPGLLKSGLKRYWPLWVAGSAALFLAFDLPIYTMAPQIARTSERLSSKLAELASMWSFMRFEGWFYAFVGSAIVALALNDHLFDSRSATFVGSLPARRESVFGSVLAGGLVVLVGIAVLAAALLLPLRATLGAVFSLAEVGRWLAVTLALVMVFYALALLSCHLSGTRSVALLLYLVMGLLAVFLEAAARLIASSLMYGITFGGLAFEWLSPAYRLAGAATGWMDGTASRWAVMGPYLLVALLAIWAARALYAHRDLESAGDSVSFAPLRPLLACLAGLSNALLFGSVYLLLILSSVANGSPLRGIETVVLAALMVAGAFLGVLFAQMIMSRSAHVLNRAWRMGLALGCVALALVGVCHFDLFGAARRVPDPAQVESVDLNGAFNTDHLNVSSEEGVAAARKLHGDLIAYGGERSDELPCFTIGLTYHLKGGKTMVRAYPVCSDYYDCLAGKRRADEGAQLINQFAAIADSQEGRESRFAPVLEADATKLVFRLEYSISAEGEYATLDLPRAEVADFIQNALRPDLMHEAAGDPLCTIEGLPAGYDANVYALSPVEEGLDDAFTQDLWLPLSEEGTPNTLAWLRAHHPEVALRAWDDYPLQPLA